ncbi:MAG: glycerol-3-phosphate dehydrogenase [Betaproteobacteria bacterium]|nr:glycerol-3-phosphate dehydrogenase [Betaproteobacteria bacterium]
MQKREATELAYDLLVVGGGINGAGIARDAAGRGLSVLLAEKDDLASATSSSSSKLIHGGLRYLEHYEFRLVAEALAEREVLLKVAAHLVWPARFVMPHVAELRPRWMIRAGLFLYDHLSRRASLPGSRSVRLDAPPYNSGIKPAFTHGFIYSDCRVDDARLVIANATDAREQGCRVLTRTECISATRENGLWRARLSNGERVTARAVVNAAGPWVKQVLNAHLSQPSRDAVRLVKGSHIVLPKLYEGEHAFILQNEDRRVIFMIPYGELHTLVGTTDIPVAGGPARPEASAEEIEYMCRAVNRYLARPVRPQDVVWSYAGVRPLYDDGTADPSAVTRDYTLRVDDEAGAAPVLSVFGGKITTYRRLAEQAMERLARYFPGLKPAWTGRTPLSGSDFGGAARVEARDAFFAGHPHLPEATLRGIFRRHGAHAQAVVGDGDLGEDFGAGLSEREVRYFVEREWAQTAQDVLWRRSKAGLLMSQAQRERVAGFLGKA